jgi:PTH1 family peptidyl-tRNA hydrolase
MKMIVGLGNPGRKYAGTRHNIGFEVVAAIARMRGGGKPRSKFQGELLEVSVHGEKVALLCPLTYMNNSGNSVQPARDFYKLTNGELLVVCDDFNLDLAKLRFRAKGSAGGQKGLADILRRLGDENIARLRIGIGASPENWDVADYVLSKFIEEEKPVVGELIERAAKAAIDWVQHGIDHCMNQYN